MWGITKQINIKHHKHIKTTLLDVLVKCYILKNKRYAEIIFFMAPKKLESTQHVYTRWRAMQVYHLR